METIAFIEGGFFCLSLSPRPRLSFHLFVHRFPVVLGESGRERERERERERGGCQREREGGGVLKLHFPAENKI